MGGIIYQHPSGIADDYTIGDCDVSPYTKIDGALPGVWQYLFRIHVFNPAKPNNYPPPLGTDYYLVNLNLAAYDGKW
jgi:hypothetical protein